MPKIKNPHSAFRIPHSAADLLFEIGTEELPAAYLPGLIEQLRTKAKFKLALYHLDYQGVEAFGTPRRLVLIVHGLSSVQRKPSQEIRGPAKSACYDNAGKPTSALLGFLRSRGGLLSQTKIVSTDKGEHVYLVKPPTEQKTVEVLGDPLSGDPLGQLINELQAPKTMRWDNSGVRFARPIRWLLALYGSAPLKVRLIGTKGTPEGVEGKKSLESGTRTFVGGPLRPKPVPVSSLGTYQRTLKQAGVLVDQTVRRARIEQDVRRLAQHAKGTPAPEMVSHGLLDEVTHLVEQPVMLAGAFDPKYLALPREVLLASMAKYQRVFAIESSGKVLPQFVAVLEGKPNRLTDVRRMIERILNARLADSLMFWEQDRQTPLSKEKDLSGITFLEGLGSMADKTKRLEQLAEVLADGWKFAPQEKDHLKRACRLAKADLVTAMVKEFPTLQGVMGKYYVYETYKDCEDKERKKWESVAMAIEEHYLPLGGKTPKTLLGRALGILDKYDTLASYFSIGIEPTGDQDPFGLRRAAQGIVEVVSRMRNERSESKIHRSLPLSRLFAAWEAVRPTANQRPDLQERLHRYLLDRLYTFAWPKPAPSRDLIEAVLSSPGDDLVDVMGRIVSLQRLNGQPALLKAAKVIERTRNILKGTALHQAQVNPDRLQEPLERRLWDLYRSHQPRLDQLAQAKSYAEATTLFGDVFFTPLHEFFDQVMVNVPDQALQQNRLALMRAINTLYTGRIADLSKLVILQQKVC